MDRWNESGAVIDGTLHRWPAEELKHGQSVAVAAFVNDAASVAGIIGQIDTSEPKSGYRETRRRVEALLDVCRQAPGQHPIAATIGQPKSRLGGGLYQRLSDCIRDL